MMKAKHMFFAALLGLAVAPDTPAQDSTVLKRLDGATGWLNSPPLSAAGLRGKVVLVDFWTYTCINWLRTLPYVRAWDEKYRDQGLVVIGAHTPEFEFEKNVANVRRAVSDMRVAYPVAIDSDYAVWRAFGNNYWPALYFIDAQGRVRYRHLGEGEYDRTERMIQQLLAEAGKGAAATGPRRRGRPRRRGGRGLGEPAVAGKLRRRRAHRKLRVAGGASRRHAARLRGAGAAAAQSMGAGG